MKIEVNIEKRYALAILGLLVIIASLIVGYAYNQSGTGGTPSSMGHSIDEIDWTKQIQNNVSAKGFCINGDCKTNWSQVGGNYAGVTLNVSGTVTIRWTSVSQVPWCASVTGTGVCGNNCWTATCANGYAACAPGDIITTPTTVNTGIDGGSHGTYMDSTYKCITLT
jgi:hypothetical protein